MEKGNFGIRLCVYTVLAFMLAYFGSATLLFLIAGVVLIAEKSEWAFRQVVQAIVLCYVGSILSSFFNIFDFIGSIPFVGAAWNVIVGVIEGLVDLAVLVFAIVAILKNLKGQDADIPFARNIANWAYGVATPKKVKVAAPAAGTAFCTKCGAPVNGQFCTACGNPVGQAAAPAPAEAPATENAQQ